MKHVKWLVPLAVVVLMLLIALPAAADDPFGGPPSKTSGNGQTTWGAIYIGGTWDNKRSTQANSQTGDSTAYNYYHDPSTGCFPSVPGLASPGTVGQVPGGAVPMTWNPSVQKLGIAQDPQPGIATQLNQPGWSKDRTTGAPVALIPGIADQQGQEFRVGGTIATACGDKDALTGIVDSVEYDRYVTNWSAKITIPGGFQSRWFKFDTVKSRDVEIYVDDVPKWGAAYRYFDNAGCVRNGTGDCDRSDNLQRIGIDTSEIGKWFLATQDRNDITGGESMFRHGIAARIYDPDNIQRMDYFWPTPNNALLTTRAGVRPRVADTQGVFGGYNRGTASVITTGVYGFGSYHWIEPGDVKKAGDGNTHLLAGKFHWDGWVYIRVFNTTIWDQEVVIGTRFTPRAGYDFPCDNCPYPFNPQFSNP